MAGGGKIDSVLGLAGRGFDDRRTYAQCFEGWGILHGNTLMLACASPSALILDDRRLLDGMASVEAAEGSRFTIN